MSHTPSGSMNRLQPPSRPPSVRNRRNQSGGISDLPTATQCPAFAFSHGAGRDTATSKRLPGPSDPIQTGKGIKRTCPMPARSDSTSSKSVKSESSSGSVPSMAKGGMVKKTGLHKLHKGEMVIPVKDVAKVKKALKSAK
jgi:hypothetical protein